MPPSLLIVVPTLNSFGLLTELLASLQQQTWPDWRLLFIDGPSSHEHRQWLQQCCLNEPRCSWISQDSVESGIFGAMNQGFASASNGSTSADFVLFWGSDDKAACPTVLEEAFAALEISLSEGIAVDLLVCRGRYTKRGSGALSREARFRSARMLSTSSYRRALWFGSTPPHQATLFGPGARQRLASYASGFRLSADLDYFLQLSRNPGLLVQCLDLELVHMADGGVSAQQTQRRVQEVCRAYRRAFGWYWWFPFLMRYLRRVASLLAWSR